MCVLFTANMFDVNFLKLFHKFPDSVTIWFDSMLVNLEFTYHLIHDGLGITLDVDSSRIYFESKLKANYESLRLSLIIHRLKAQSDCPYKCHPLGLVRVIATPLPG